MLKADPASPTFGAEVAAGVALQSGEARGQLALQLADRLAFDRPNERARVVFDDIAYQDAEGRERTGILRHDDARDAERARQVAGVHAAGAAEGDEREVTRIVAALDRDHADGLLHGRIHYAHYTGRKLRERKPRAAAAQPCGRDLLRALGVEFEIAAQEAPGGKTAEQQVRVGHGGLRATTVADGAGIGARGFRAHAQRAGSVEACDGAAARADGVDIKHRDAHRQACHLAFRGRARVTVDQRDVGGRAAHVKGDDAGEPAAPGHRGRPDHAAGGTGEHGAGWLARGGRKRGDPAARLHDENGAARPAAAAQLRDPLREARKVLLHHGL